MRCSRLRWLRPFALVAWLGGCGGGGGSGGGEPVLPGLVVGAAEAVVDVPFDGCPAAGFEVTTPTGVKLVLAPGTCLRTRLGAIVRGRLALGLDAGGADAAYVAGLEALPPDALLRGTLVDVGTPVVLAAALGPPQPGLLGIAGR